MSIPPNGKVDSVPFPQLVYGLAAFDLYTLASRQRLKVVIESVSAKVEPDAEGTAAGNGLAGSPAEQSMGHFKYGPSVDEVT